MWYLFFVKLIFDGSWPVFYLTFLKDASLKILEKTIVKFNKNVDI